MRNRSIQSLGALLAGLLIAGDALATWSIVVVDRRTREVCVATATCITNGNIHRRVPIVVVGKGAAAAQSFIGQGRPEIIFDGLINELTPTEIFDAVALTDNGLQSRQYGIVNLQGSPVTFTGTLDGAWAGGLTGADGNLMYAIQGNVLTGAPVIAAAESAFLATEGDMTQRVMRAMEAAAYYGGDGRCSCNSATPDGCGSPPANFTKSAHTAVIVAARVGDTDGACGPPDGCVTGDYYLLRKVNGDWSDPDPILVLREKYEVWRDFRAGKPDHYKTEVLQSAIRSVADGQSVVRVDVRLRDLEGSALTFGGQTLTVEWVGSGSPLATVGALVDNGDGSHSFELTTGTQAGQGEWAISVQQAQLVMRLWPNLQLSVDPVRQLHAGVVRVLADDATEIGFVLNLGSAAAGRDYQVLGSAAGTSPGTPWMGQSIPLNSDRLFRWTLNYPGGAAFPGSFGQLDANGRAEARLRLPPVGLNPFVGSVLDFAAILPQGASGDITNGAAVEIRP
jgi:uncharacterized Ntn-hydrolase superfamily protein